MRAPRSRPAVSYVPPQASASVGLLDMPGGLPGSRVGLEGASTTSREMVTWRPSMGSPDRIINGVKDLVDARGRDVAMNDGGGAHSPQ